jgi:tryptophan 2,3-dioxygenase
MDFLDFRDMLRPAAGFQSWQFKILEAKLGLSFSQRFGQEYYLSQLGKEEVERIKKVESEKTLLELVNAWLERMPFLNDESLLPGFWPHYRELLTRSLAPEERNNESLYDAVFSGNSAPAEPGVSRALSPAACRAGLFIMLYQGYPMLQLPFQLLNQLLETDEQLSTWRYRHLHMVHRTIGTRIGTGGSTGKGYLHGTLDKHFIFREIAQLTSFLIERKKLPVLSREMERRLGFAN